MQDQATALRDHAATPEDGDGALMRRIAAGDEQAFRQLCRRHLPPTVRLAARMLGSDGAADDVAQEAFIRVWKHAGGFEDPEQRGAKFTTWLYRIVANLCIDQKRKTRYDGGTDDLDALESGQPDAELQLRQKEQSARVRAALATLPDRQRAAFVLCFYEGLSNREAAETMGVGLKALESLLVRARRDLRDMLQDERSGT